MKKEQQSSKEMKRSRTTKISKKMKRLKTMKTSSMIEEKPKETKKPRSVRGDISIIPDDLLVSIFLRLPARSVGAVRGVCKSWHSLTLTSSFVLEHAHRARTSIIIQPHSPYYYSLYHIDHSKYSKQIVQKNLTHPRSIRNYAVNTPYLKMVASCDGLLCFQEMIREEYIVCNLVTKDWITVQDSAILAAFYFHRSTGEYRLLQYYTNNIGVATGPEVISICGLDDEWRTLPYYATLSADMISHPQSCKQISVHGNVHWPPCPNCSWMLVFDTELEKFRRMSLSQIHKKEDTATYDLIEMEGSLGLCSQLINSDEMEVWFLEDYAKEEWIKRYSVSLHSIAKSLYRSRELNCCSPLAVWNNGKELLLKFYDSDYKFNCFVLYNLGSKVWRKQRIPTSETNLRNWVPYVESLVSCNSLKK